MHSAVRKGIQATVSLTSGSAGDIPNGLRMPNQIKMTANE